MKRSWREWLYICTGISKPEAVESETAVEPSIPLPSDWPLGQFTQRTSLPILNKSAVGRRIVTKWKQSADAHPYFAVADKWGWDLSNPGVYVTCDTTATFLILGKNGTHAIVLILDDDSFSDIASKVGCPANDCLELASQKKYQRWSWSDCSSYPVDPYPGAIVMIELALLERCRQRAAMRVRNIHIADLIDRRVGDETAALVVAGRAKSEALGVPLP